MHRTEILHIWQNYTLVYVLFWGFFFLDLHSYRPSKAAVWLRTHKPGWVTERLPSTHDVEMQSGWWQQQGKQHVGNDAPCRKPCFPTSARAAESSVSTNQSKNWADWSDWWGQWVVALPGHCPGEDLVARWIWVRRAWLGGMGGWGLQPRGSSCPSGVNYWDHMENKHWPTPATRNPRQFPSHISRCPPRTDFPMPVMMKDPCPSSPRNNTSKKAICLFNFLWCQLRGFLFLQEINI